MRDALHVHNTIPCRQINPTNIYWCLSQHRPHNHFAPLPDTLVGHVFMESKIGNVVQVCKDCWKLLGGGGRDGFPKFQNPKFHQNGLDFHGTTSIGAVLQAHIPFDRGTPKMHQKRL